MRVEWPLLVKCFARHGSFFTNLTPTSLAGTSLARKSLARTSLARTSLACKSLARTSLACISTSYCLFEFARERISLSLDRYSMPV